jgi:hypothetical protein
VVRGEGSVGVESQADSGRTDIALLGKMRRRPSPCIHFVSGHTAVETGGARQGCSGTRARSGLLHNVVWVRGTHMHAQCTCRSGYALVLGRKYVRSSELVVNASHKREMDGATDREIDGATDRATDGAVNKARQRKEQLP